MSKIASVPQRSLNAGIVLLSLFLFITPQRAQAQPAECLPSDVLLVVDHSGSMSSSNKWSDAQSALNQLLTKFSQKLRFGLITFSSAAKLQVNVGPNTSAQVQSVLGQLGPTGTTAMKCALQESFKHYQTYAIPRDSVKDRRRFVVLITDGTPNTCGTDVIPEVAKLRNVPVAGQNYDIKTFVIGFGSGVNATQLQGMAVAGGTGNYYQANNLASLQKALDAIGNGTSKEVCDNKDNDCDGVVDEFKESCQGACGSGTRHCSQGKWTQCSSANTPSPEVCDNVDNDCNGKVDDNLPDRDCTSACGRGKEKCVAGQWTGCNAPKPQTEICNGKDDNCNGQIDEDLRQPCKTQCGAGTQACIQGDWSSCSAPSPSLEICDGVDNDCNGQVDDGIKPEECNGQCVSGVCQPKCRAGECIGNKLCVDGFCVDRPCEPACQSGETCRSGRCVPGDCTQVGGECVDGKELCVNKKCTKNPCLGVQCGKDQFCRGGQCIHSCADIDCPQGGLCKNGSCQQTPCDTSCAAGSSCVQDKCVPDTCGQCPKGQVCKGASCVDDLCHGVSCATGQKCFEGECYGPNGPGTLPIDPGPINPGPVGSDGGTTDGGNGGDNNGNTNNTDDPTNDPDNPLDPGKPGTPGGRGNGGCLCNAGAGIPGIPFGLLFLVLLAPILRRRKKHIS